MASIASRPIVRAFSLACLIVTGLSFMSVVARTPDEGTGTPTWQPRPRQACGNPERGGSNGTGYCEEFSNPAQRCRAPLQCSYFDPPEVEEGPTCICIANGTIA